MSKRTQSLIDYAGMLVGALAAGALLALVVSSQRVVLPEQQDPQWEQWYPQPDVIGGGR